MADKNLRAKGKVFELRVPIGNDHCLKSNPCFASGLHLVMLGRGMLSGLMITDRNDAPISIYRKHIEIFSMA